MAARETLCKRAYSKAGSSLACSVVFNNTITTISLWLPTWQCFGCMLPYTIIVNYNRPLLTAHGMWICSLSSTHVEYEAQDKSKCPGGMKACAFNIKNERKYSWFESSWIRPCPGGPIGLSTHSFFKSPYSVVSQDLVMMYTIHSPT